MMVEYNYNRLWKLLIDKGMNKKELSELSGVSLSTLARMKHNMMVTMNVLSGIMSALGCTLEEIVEITYDKTDKRER